MGELRRARILAALEAARELVDQQDAGRRREEGGPQEEADGEDRRALQGLPERIRSCRVADAPARRQPRARSVAEFRLHRGECRAPLRWLPRAPRSRARLTVACTSATVAATRPWPAKRLRQRDCRLPSPFRCSFC